MPLDQNPHQTLTSMSQLFNVCVRVFCDQNAAILLIYIPAKIKMNFTWKDDFFSPKLASSVSRSQSHLAKRKPIGWSIDFNTWTNWTLYGVIQRYLCKIRLNDVSENFQVLRTTVNWCWWRFTHSFYHSSNILRCTHCFWLFMLWFIYEDASFFYFFHKITNLRSWRCFSSSKIRPQFSHTFTLPLFSK